METLANIIQNLNPPQRKAVETTDGALLVLAGAGTGKTRVLTTRLAHILDSGRANPNEILAVTFTNKAAKEMAERVEQTLGRPTSGMFLGTFHALGARFIRKHAERIGLKSDFIILTPDDQKTVVKQLMTEKNIDESRWPAKQAVGIISKWKDNAWTPADVPKGEGGQFAGGKLVEIYTNYQARLKALNACDFGDLLLHAVTLLKENQDLLQRYQQQFKYILVDEYQDTNVVQYLWLRLLAMGHRNICVVGDDDQSIYAWRGAQVGNILRFEEDFPGAGVVRLEQNYRSTGHILKAASELIKNNSQRHGKTLWTQDGDGLPIELATVWDEKEEARSIITEVDKHFKGGGAYADCAILLRTAAQTRAFEEQFIRQGMPYVIIGGLKFYERKEIRDALAYLRMTHTQADDLAFERIVNVPKRGVGDTSLKTIRELARMQGVPMFVAAQNAAADGTLSGKAANALREFCEMVNQWQEAKTWQTDQLMERLLEESGYLNMLKEDKNKEEAKGRLDNLKELIRSMQDYDDISTYLEHIALVTDTDADETSDAVRMMTVHAAKGLEFDTVFLPGFEEGLFPHQRSLDDSGAEGLEEERRLAYVAITRGRRRVVISYASSRRLYGNYMPTSASRFINELPDDSIKRVSVESYHGQSGGQSGGSYSSGSYSGTGSRPWQTQQSDSWAPRKSTPLFKAENKIKRSDDDGAEDGLPIGHRVFHDKFGYGRIRRKEGNGASLKVIIAFDKAGEKKLLASMANLKSA
tara:strand:- start:76621 stop:78885 length:2265 start_codon:yes stop_codon:yes gene_type:complete